MYFHTSLLIANEQPELENKIETIDRFLFKRSNMPFELHRAASHVRINAALLERILDLYVAKGALEIVEYRTCPIHHGVLTEQEDGLWICDLCDNSGYSAEECILSEQYHLLEVPLTQSIDMTRRGEMASHEVIRALRDVLVILYPTANMANLVAAQAGLNVQLIDFSGPSIQFWHSILTVANNNNQLQEVINIARSQNPGNQALRDAEQLANIGGAPQRDDEEGSAQKSR